MKKEGPLSNFSILICDLHCFRSFFLFFLNKRERKKSFILNKCERAWHKLISFYLANQQNGCRALQDLEATVSDISREEEKINFHKKWVEISSVFFFFFRHTGKVHSVKTEKMSDACYFQITTSN